MDRISNEEELLGLGCVRISCTKMESGFFRGIVVE